MLGFLVYTMFMFFDVFCVYICVYATWIFVSRKHVNISCLYILCLCFFSKTKPADITTRMCHLYQPRDLFHVVSNQKLAFVAMRIFLERQESHIQSLKIRLGRLEVSRGVSCRNVPWKLGRRWWRCVVYQGAKTIRRDKRSESIILEIRETLGIQSYCQRMMKGCPITSEKHSIDVFRFHETIFSFGELIGSVGKVKGIDSRLSPLIWIEFQWCCHANCLKLTT